MRGHGPSETVGRYHYVTVSMQSSAALLFENNLRVVIILSPILTANFQVDLG